MYIFILLSIFSQYFRPNVGLSDHTRKKDSEPQLQIESGRVEGIRSKVSGSTSKSKKQAKVSATDGKHENNVTLVSNRCELVGKLVEHFCYFDKE